MKMSRLEKVVMNITARARNIKAVERLLGQIDSSNVKKVLEIGCGTECSRLIWRRDTDGK